MLLGTAGGPNWWPPNPSGAGGPERVSVSSALVVGDAIYIVDLGHGSAHRLAQALISGKFNSDGVEAGYQTYLSNLKAIFFTHLHMDHTTDYPSILLCGYGEGIGKSTDPNEPAIPVQMYGPSNRGQLQKDVCKLHVPVVNPRNPTPGTVEMTDYLWQASARLPIPEQDAMRSDGAFRNLPRPQRSARPVPGTRPPRRWRLTSRRRTRCLAPAHGASIRAGKRLPAW